MRGLHTAVLILALMALATAASVEYFEQIAKDRADPVINPAWPSGRTPVTDQPRMRVA
jgi:hypothetical protein